MLKPNLIHEKRGWFPVMKFARGLLDLLLVVLALVRFSDAASFMRPRQVSLVSKDKEMPITKHDKTAGGAYNKGSPLYKKQQAQKASGVTEVKEEKPPAKSGKDGSVVSITSPPPDKITGLAQWWIKPVGFYEHIEKGFLSFIMYFIFVMLAALIWMKCAGGRCRRGYDERKNTPMVSPMLPPFGFAYGLFSMDHCFGHHSSVCICSWCCAPLRLADTYAKEPLPLIASFWTALVLVTTLLGLNQLTLGVSHVIFLIMAIYYRQQLRKQYGLTTGAKAGCTDFLAWFFCPWCAIAQEARQVEFVKKPNDPVK